MNEYTSDMVSAIASAGLRAAAGAFAANKLEQKQTEAMFVDAGAELAGYERDGSEESDLRAVVFCGENMRRLAAHMREVDDFRWWGELKLCLDQLVDGSELQDKNKQVCKKRFLDLIQTKLRKDFPKLYERGMQEALYASVQDIGQRVVRMGAQVDRLQQFDEAMRAKVREHEEKRQRPRQTYSEYVPDQEHVPEYAYMAEHRNASDQDIKKSIDVSASIPKWNLKHLHIEGIFKPEDEQKAEIHRLIEAWESERKSYPGWYVLPFSVCEKLAVNTMERGLLQNDTKVDTKTMLLFAYELVWRYEKCMYPYFGYEAARIRSIWEQYAAVIRDLSKEELSDEPRQADVKKWFYIGQALLRMYREGGQDAAWKSVYRVLKEYEAYGTNGRVDLQLEKAKCAFFHLNIPALRREIARVNPGKTQYEQRLQLLGLRIECDDARAVLEDLRKLQADIEEALAGELADDYRVFCGTLWACSLQLLSLCVQGISDYEETYEAHQEEINRILEASYECRMLFDWDDWSAQAQNSLLVWHTKKYSESEPFALNRETLTLFASGNYCETAYRFYRVIERLALPLRCGYVNLIGGIEQAWMEAVLDINFQLGVFLLAQSNRSDTIKTLADRAFAVSLDADSAEKLIEFCMDALANNLDELNDQDAYKIGNLAMHLQDNVPELLVRFMSRCPKRLQKKALLLLKTLMEDEELPVRFPMTQLLVGVMDQVAEEIKAQVLGIMLGTKIFEHRSLYGHGDGIDIFACYFRKEELGKLRAYCTADSETIAWLLENPLRPDDAHVECGTSAGQAIVYHTSGIGIFENEPNDSAHSGKRDSAEPDLAGRARIYEWQTKVLRLEILDGLKLLSEEQRRNYAKLLWSRVGANGLPDLPQLHLFAYDTMPCVDSRIPVQSVKGSFLYRRLADQLIDKEGCSFTMGHIPYLDELVLLCRNAGRDYWSKEEAWRLLENILDYWRVLKERCGMSIPDSAVQGEYKRRGSKMVSAAAAVCGNISDLPDAGVLDALREMAEEMQEYGISTKELEVFLRPDEFLSARIRDEIRSDDDPIAVGALNAAYQYIAVYPDAGESRILLDAVIAVLRYRKTLGLQSAVWLLHNLVYEKNPILNDFYLSVIDCCLEELADVIRPENDACRLRIKEIISIQKACAALAFQMYYRAACENRPGVLLWKRLAAENECNEVKNEWVW